MVGKGINITFTKEKNMKSFQLKKEETHINDFFFKREEYEKFSAYCGFSWELIFLKPYSHQIPY